MSKSNNPNSDKSDKSEKSKFRPSYGSSQKHDYNQIHDYHHYVVEAKNPANREEIASYFGVQPDTVYRQLREFDCIGQVNSRPPKYFHKDELCQVGIFDTKIPSEKFRVMIAEHGFPNWFNLDLLFEISGEHLTSPSYTEVCDKGIYLDTTLEWEYCHFRLRIVLVKYPKSVPTH